MIGRGVLNTRHPGANTALIEVAQFYEASAVSGRSNSLASRFSRGDTLHIPELSPAVSVVGAVNSPKKVLFEEGRDRDYYIENAGGCRQDADRGRVSVGYANGSAAGEEGRVNVAYANGSGRQETCCVAFGVLLLTGLRQYRRQSSRQANYRERYDLTDSGDGSEIVLCISEA